MSEAHVAIVDLADEFQVRKQTIFKLIKRLGIRSAMRRESSRGNQKVATVSLADAAALRNELARLRARALVSDADADAADTAQVRELVGDDIGVFYLVQLEPEHDPGRFKLGFTAELEGRIRKHRCSAPFAQCVRTWPCRRTWERAAIDSATNGCEQLHTEVFRTSSLDQVLARADAFFAVMPTLAPQPEPRQRSS